MGKKSPGHIEQLPSGSWRVKVYGGTDPLTGREIRLRKTCKTERAALIELGKLLEQAAAGRQPETNATVAELMDHYAEVADWDLSTQKANEAYIRRVIKPALGHLQVRKIRGPLFDLLYAQLRRCGDPGCTGKRFLEHRNVPTLSVVTPSRRPAWQQVADTLRDAVNSGMLGGRIATFCPGDEHPARRAGRDATARPSCPGRGRARRPPAGPDRRRSRRRRGGPSGGPGCARPGP